MSTGERITGSRFSGILQNRKIRILDPGTGYTAGDLHRLAGDRPQKAHTHQIVSTAFADAPEHNKSDDQKCRFLTERRDSQHQLIQKRIPDPFKKIQKFHNKSPFRSGSAFYRIITVFVRNVKFLPWHLQDTADTAIIGTRKGGLLCFHGKRAASMRKIHWQR